MLSAVGLKTHKRMQAWQQPWWFLKIHNRKCNSPPPSLAIHQKQTESPRPGGRWQREDASTLLNRGPGAFTVAHTGGRRLEREGAGKMSPSSKHYPLGAKTTENHAASTWPPPLPVPRVTLTARTRGPADTGWRRRLARCPEGCFCARFGLPASFPLLPL